MPAKIPKPQRHALLKTVIVLAIPLGQQDYNQRIIEIPPMLLSTASAWAGGLLKNLDKFYVTI